MFAMIGRDSPITALIQSGTGITVSPTSIWNGKANMTMNSNTSQGEFRNAWVTAQAIFRSALDGDICHHPIQVVLPEWNSAFCELPDQARATRLDVLNRCHDTHALMLPAHFGGAHAGYVEDASRGFRFRFQP